MNKWQPGDPETCEYCAWSKRHKIGAKVTCMVNPDTVTRVGDEYCHKWGATRVLASGWVDKSKTAAVRAMMYRTLCVDASSLLQNSVNAVLWRRRLDARLAQDVAGET